MSPEGYRDMIKAFLDRKISAWDFCREFQEGFLQETGGMDDDLYHILDKMWGAAEMYSPVEITFYITEEQLREESIQYLAELEDYIARKGAEAE